MKEDSPNEEKEAKEVQSPEAKGILLGRKGSHNVPQTTSVHFCKVKHIQQIKKHIRRENQSR